MIKNHRRCNTERTRKAKSTDWIIFFFSIWVFWFDDKKEFVLYTLYTYTQNIYVPIFCITNE